MAAREDFVDESHCRLSGVSCDLLKDFSKLEIATKVPRMPMSLNSSKIENKLEGASTGF